MRRPQLNNGSLLVGNNVLNDSDGVFDDLMTRHNNHLKGAKEGGHKVLQRMGTHVQQTPYKSGKSNTGHGLSHGLYLPDTDRSLFRPQSLKPETMADHEQYRQPGMKTHANQKRIVSTLKQMQDDTSFNVPPPQITHYHGNRGTKNANLMAPKPLPDSLTNAPQRHSGAFNVVQRHENTFISNDDTDEQVSKKTSTYIQHLRNRSNEKYVHSKSMGSAVSSVGAVHIPGGHTHPASQLRNGRYHHGHRNQIRTRRGGGWISQPSKSLAEQIIKIVSVLNKKSDTVADATMVHSWYAALLMYQNNNSPLPVDTSLIQVLSIFNNYHSPTSGTDAIYNSIIVEAKNSIWDALINAGIVASGSTQKTLDVVITSAIPDDKSAPLKLPDATPNHPAIVDVINNFHT